MTRILPRFLLFCLLLAPALRAGEAPSFFQGKGLQVRLVSDHSSIQPGQVFYLGLWITHEPGYHTYWKNPGLAGVPTKLVPTLPPDFTAGEMLYPPPDKVKMAAINVHGYGHDVLVALPVTAPASLPPGGTLTIPVEATWMCCQRTCNPGHAKLGLTLKTGAASTADETWQPKFQSLLASAPPALTGWTLTASRSGKYVDLTARPPAGIPIPEAPQFFSLDNLICSHPAQVWKPDGTGVSVRLELSDFLPADQTQLRGVLRGKTPWLAGGTSSFAIIAVPITPEKP